jgi:hypothetical protein
MMACTTKRHSNVTDKTLESTVCSVWRNSLIYETTKLTSNRVPTDLITGAGTPGWDHCDLSPDRYLSH